MKKLFTALCLFSMFALTVGASFAEESVCTRQKLRMLEKQQLRTKTKL